MSEGAKAASELLDRLPQAPQEEWPIILTMAIKELALAECECSQSPDGACPADIQEAWERLHRTLIDLLS